MSNFSNQPKMKNWEIIHTTEQLIILSNKMSTLTEWAYDTETSTLRTHAPTSEFLLVGVSISWSPYDNYYIPLNHIREEDYYFNATLEDFLYYFKPIFEKEDIRLIGWNIKFDMHVLARIGIFIKTFDLFDGMIASFLCDENSPNGLKENTLEKLNIEQGSYKEIISTVPKEVRKEYGYKSNSRIPFQLVLINNGAYYAVEDSFYTWELYLGFENELEDEGMLSIYNSKYKPFIQCMFKVEERGVVIDIKRLEKMQKDINKDCEDLSYKMLELAGVEFNPNSNQHRAELMFGWEKPDGKNKANRNQEIIDNNFGFKPLTFTPKGMPQTNNELFWTYSNFPDTRNKRKQEGIEFCRLMVEYSKIEKLRSTFVDGIFENMYDDNKIHCNFNLIGARSGRISASNINLQQLPNAEDNDKYQIRSLFIGSINKKTGKRKKILAFDYDNLEMKILAIYSKDPKLTEMFLNGEDAHGSTAVNMFELDCSPAEVKKEYPHLRQASKTINFLLNYGGGAKILYETLLGDHYSPIDLGGKEYLEQYKCKNGIEVAQKYIDKYFTTYKGVANFIKSQKQFAHKNGYVQTIIGRKRRLPMLTSSNPYDVYYGERLSSNAPTQGGASDIIMSAQNLIDQDERLEKLGVVIVSQVHDELILECPEENVEEASDLIKYYMENMFGKNTEKLGIPITVSSGVGDNYYEAK